MPDTDLENSHDFADGARHEQRSRRQAVDRIDERGHADRSSEFFDVDAAPAGSGGRNVQRHRPSPPEIDSGAHAMPSHQAPRDDIAPARHATAGPAEAAPPASSGHHRVDQRPEPSPLPLDRSPLTDLPGSRGPIDAGPPPPATPSPVPPLPPVGVSGVSRGQTGQSRPGPSSAGGQAGPVNGLATPPTNGYGVSTPTRGVPMPPNGVRNHSGPRPPAGTMPFGPNGAGRPPVNGQRPAPPVGGPRIGGVQGIPRDAHPTGPATAPPQPRIPTPPPGTRRAPIPVDPRMPAHHTGPRPTAGQLNALRTQNLDDPRRAAQQQVARPARPRPQNADYAVVVENLRKSYGAVDALRGISFTVERGEVLAVLGPNGAGKTTTVDILCTLNKPTSGTALIDGYDVVDDAAAVRRSIMLTGQQVALDDMLTGRENLVMFGRLQGMRKPVAKQRAEELLDQFDLQYAADRRIGTFSGGMRRRIDIACGLVVRPAVVFLDEPTTGLDPRSRQNVWDLVARFKEQGITTLLTTQYLEEADALSDRIVVIDRGTVIAEGTADELKERTGSTYLEIVPRNVADIPRILNMLGPMQPRTKRNVMTGVDDRVGMPAPHGPRTLLAAAAQLDSAGVPLIDIGLRRPSLDEVFFALTGDNTPKPDEDDQP